MYRSKIYTIRTYVYIIILLYTVQYMCIMLTSIRTKNVDFQQVANLQMVEKLLMDGDEPVWVDRNSLPLCMMEEGSWALLSTQHL